MKALCHFESIERKTSQLRSLIEALKREVLGLEADITDVETFDRQANPPKSAYPIAARTVKARRDNLVRTILILQGGKLNELNSFNSPAPLQDWRLKRPSRTGAL